MLPPPLPTPPRPTPTLHLRLLPTPFSPLPSLSSSPIFFLFTHTLWVFLSTSPPQPFLLPFPLNPLNKKEER
ncbi:hypothetical protein ACB092_03G107300 [Castanea dentata]